MNIKSILIRVVVFCNLTTIQGQKIGSISIAPIFEGNVLSTKGFDRLNSVLIKQNLYTFQNEFRTNGFSFCFTNKHNKGGMEFNYATIASHLYDSTNTTNRSALPFLRGSNFRILYFRKLFESNRWYGTAALGLSMIKLNFKLVDGFKPRLGFDSLLVNPNLSATLDLQQSRGSINAELSSSIYFKTKWLKKAFDDFDIGARFGYVQPLLNDNTWVINGTLNNFIPNGLPAVDLNNLYFQLSFLFKYKFSDNSQGKEQRRTNIIRRG